MSTMMSFLVNLLSPQIDSATAAAIEARSAADQRAIKKTRRLATLTSPTDSTLDCPYSLTLDEVLTQTQYFDYNADEWKKIVSAVIARFGVGGWHTIFHGSLRRLIVAAHQRQLHEPIVSKIVEEFQALPKEGTGAKDLNQTPEQWIIQRFLSLAGAMADITVAGGGKPVDRQKARQGLMQTACYLVKKFPGLPEEFIKRLEDLSRNGELPQAYFHCEAGTFDPRIEDILVKRDDQFDQRRVTGSDKIGNGHRNPKGKKGPYGPGLDAKVGDLPPAPPATAPLAATVRIAENADPNGILAAAAAAALTAEQPKNGVHQPPTVMPPAVMTESAPPLAPPVEEVVAEQQVEAKTAETIINGWISGSEDQLRWAKAYPVLIRMRDQKPHLMDATRLALLGQIEAAIAAELEPPADVDDEELKALGF